MAMFLWWVTLLAVLAMVMLAEVPKRLRVWALVSGVLTVWFLWGWYGVELFADAKWPKTEVAEKASAPSAATSQPLADTGANKDKDKDKKTGSGDAPTERLGQVGDLFGGINALFAALAFAGVVYAASLQAKSTLIASRQAIESMFFSALELHHRIADELQFDLTKMHPEKREEMLRFLRAAGVTKSSEQVMPAKGRTVFAAVLAWVASDGTSYTSTIANYRYLQSRHNYVLGHYFRNLYQVLKLIDEGEALDGPSKQKFASILRAQLSSEELALLMVNCADDMVDEGQFRNLLVRYRMLEHLPLTKAGDQYVRSDGGYRVVLADASSIGQYKAERRIANVTEKLHGAFGTNPAF